MHPILVTRRIPRAGLDRLREAGIGFDVIDQDAVPDRDLVLKRGRGREGLLTMLSERVDAEFLDAIGPQLKCVANCAVGFNNIDLDEATRRGVAVCNTPGVLTDATADLTWALILATARRVAEGDRMVRAGRFAGWAPMMLLGADLVGKTLGVVGAGRIGSAVARRSRGWDMRAIYVDPTPRPDLESEIGARRVDLDTLCRESDIVTVHVPHSEETHHLFTAERFERMKETAIFINTARGPVHDEAALAAALREGRIGGAGLDVYEHEPTVHPDLLGLDSAVLLPHMGSGTVQTRDRMATLAAENLITTLSGERPPNLVNTRLHLP